MVNGGEPRTINLDGADATDFKIVDENINFAFGGRYSSDDYIKVQDDHGNDVDMHKVSIELLCDHDQFIALLRAMHDGDGLIHVKLV